MASQSVESVGSVVIRGENHTLPISFPVSDDGFSTVSSARLASRFHIDQNCLHVDRDVLDPVNNVVSHTVAVFPILLDGREVWTLSAGTYSVYGSRGNSSSYISESIDNVIPLLRKVKLEPDDIHVVDLSNDSDCEVVPVRSKPLSDNSVHKSTLARLIPSQITVTPTSKPPRPPPGSILQCLRLLNTRRGSKSVFSKIDYSSIAIFEVKFVPPTFDGDVIFELPPVGDYTPSSKAGQLQGMDKKHDGHAWTRTVTSHIKSDFDLTFRMSMCLGHLTCSNSSCDYLSRVGRFSDINETEWEGTASSPFTPQCNPPPNSTVVCAICHVAPTCVSVCPARIYYVHGHSKMTRACVHLGSHSHPVKSGNYRDSSAKLKTLIGEQVERTPTATNSAIILEATKEYLGELLLCPDGVPQKSLVLEELLPVLDRFKEMSSPSVRNEVTTFRYLRRFGVMDSITRLRGCSNWAFVQENRFPGQGTDSDKVFIFKMAEIGPGSGVDLVRRMQPGGDIEDAWMMFDHVKRVKSWTTMACHVYDSIYCRVMTIAVCDMQSEDVAAQVVFWKNLNAVASRNDIPNPNFKGFMADSAQANWNAVRIVYGSGDPTVRMDNRERTCLFHWTQSMEKHTKADIRSDLQEQHRRLCRQYKNSVTMEEAETRYLAIRAWWLSSGATSDQGLPKLELWLAFWHFRYRQWGGFMDLDLSETELAEMPSCNLAETVHNKWLQQSGNRGNDLFVAAVDDMVRAFMQVVRYFQFLKGEKPGTGPCKDELRLRSAARTAMRSGSSNGLHAALATMPGADSFCTRKPHLEGEEVFLSVKRKADLPPGSEFDSHRPDKISISRPRVKTRSQGPSMIDLSTETEHADVSPGRHVSDPEPSSVAATSTAHHVKFVQESDCDERQWHIARLPKTSAKACFALQAVTRKKCVNKIVQNGRSTPAPTYTGMMDNYKKSALQQMQFFYCNDDIERCVKGVRRKWVQSKPPVPDVWPVKIGTNLKESEILDLENAGFRLPERVRLSPRKLFASGLHVNFDEYPVPLNPAMHPTMRFGKNIRRNPKAPSSKHHSNCASAHLMSATIKSILMVPLPALGCIVTLECRTTTKVSTNLLTIGQFPSCDCKSFKEMSAKSLGKAGSWTYCMHMYYIITTVCGLDVDIDVFMHAPSFSWNEIMRILQILLLKHYGV